MEIICVFKIHKVCVWGKLFGSACKAILHWWPKGKWKSQCICTHVHKPIYNVNIKETCRNITYVQANVKLEVGLWTRDMCFYEWTTKAQFILLYCVAREMAGSAKCKQTPYCIFLWGADCLFSHGKKKL